jgi:hypothetical protein
MMVVKNLDDMKAEAKFWWTCSFCGFDKNIGTTDECEKCQGIRKTA